MKLPFRIAFKVLSVAFGLTMTSYVTVLVMGDSGVVRPVVKTNGNPKSGPQKVVSGPPEKEGSGKSVPPQSDPPGPKESGVADHADPGNQGPSVAFLPLEMNDKDEPQPQLPPQKSRHPIPAENTATNLPPMIHFSPGIEALPTAVTDVDLKLTRIIDRLDRMNTDIQAQADRTQTAERVKEIAEIIRQVKEQNLLAVHNDRESSGSKLPAEEQPPAVVDAPAAENPEKSPEVVAKPKLMTRAYRPRFLTGSAFLTLIQPVLTPAVGRAAATDRSPETEPSDAADSDNVASENSVVVTDTEEVLRKIDSLYNKLDVAPEQVVLEALVISLQLDERHPHGLDLLEFNGSNQPFMMTAVEGGSSSANHPHPGTNDPLKLTRRYGLKRGILNGDPQALISSLQSAMQVRRIDAWQLNVASRQSALLMLTDPFGAEGTSDHTAAGAILKIRPLVGREGTLHLDIRQERGLDLLASTGGRAAALTNQFSLFPGQTAVIGGFFAEQPVIQTFCPTGVSKIPLVRGLFSKQVKGVERVETLVILTPHLASAAVEPDIQRVSHPSARPILPEKNRRMIIPTSGTVEHRPPLKLRLMPK
jgi:type II secretory pathway component GspD/PulD (secretin)